MKLKTGLWIIGIIIFLTLTIEAQKNTTVTVTESLIINLTPSGDHKSAELEKEYTNLIMNVLLVSLWVMFLGIIIVLRINKTDIPTTLIIIFVILTFILLLYFTNLYNGITTPLEFK